MSNSNQVNTEIPQAIIDAVVEKLSLAKKDLAPYMHALSNEDRQSLFKMGDKTLATVVKTQSFTLTNPEFVPNYMDLAAFNQDIAVANQLRPVLDLVNQLVTDVSDTAMLAGSEALEQALMYYGQVREADSRKVESSRAIYEDLKPRFARRSKKNPPMP
jgi:hypothetical protein